MNLTLKSEGGRYFIDAEWLQALGIEENEHVEISREGQRLVVQATRDTRLGKLNADLDRLMAQHAESLPKPP